MCVHTWRLQLGYAFASAFSGVSMFNSLCVATYNAILFVPVVFFFLDKDMPAKMLLARPQLYYTSRDGMLMTYGTMGLWLLRAFVQSIIVMCIGLAIVPSTRSDVYDSLGARLSLLCVRGAALPIVFVLRFVHNVRRYRFRCSAL